MFKSKNYSSNPLIKFKSKNSMIKKLHKISTINSIVPIMLILLLLIAVSSPIMVKSMGPLDPPEKAGCGILKISMMAKTLLRNLLYSNLMLNFVTYPFIPKFKLFLPLPLIYVHRLQMENFSFGLMTQNYLSKSHSS